MWYCNTGGESTTGSTNISLSVALRLVKLSFVKLPAVKEEHNIYAANSL
jgi:hypothetical protein